MHVGMSIEAAHAGMFIKMMGAGFLEVPQK